MKPKVFQVQVQVQKHWICHDEIGELSLKRNQMIQRLERSFAEMQRFTADAAHELRTPQSASRPKIFLAFSIAFIA